MNERLPCLVGGASALLIGLGYVAIISLYAFAGAPPAPTDALLQYLTTNAAKWWWIIGLSVLTDFLFIPLTATLYLVLGSIDRYLMWLASACIILFVFLDLAITWTNYVAAMSLHTSTAAEPIVTVLHSNLLFVYNTLTLAIGILLSGVVMLRSPLGKGAACLGVITGCVGVLAVAGSFFSRVFSSAVIIASCLTTLWVVVIGYQFCRRAQHGQHS